MSRFRKCWGSFIRYFLDRRWLLVWMGIFTVAIILLALTGQIRTQGNGRVTPYEWGGIGIVVGVWLIAKIFFKNDLTEEYLVGLLFGIQWEFLTEPYWTYLPDRFNILVWKDIPLLMLGGWSTALTGAILLSHKFTKWFFGVDPKKTIFDWRMLACDALAISIVGIAGEWLYGIYFHCWDYTLPFNIGTSPFFNLGWEVHIGYITVMFWYGATFRVWKLKLEGSLPLGKP